MEFDFFGRLRLTVDTGGHRGYEKYFQNEYRRISAGATPNEDAPTIAVRIVRRLPLRDRGSIRRSVRCKKLFTFNYVVEGIDTQEVQIHFQTHPVDKLYINAVAVFLQAQVIEPIMYLKLLESGVLLMHAAGVCDENGGYLFPAHGGTGKTTLAIALLSHGYKLLGDDLLIVDPKGKRVYPYQRPLHLFTYNINNLQGAHVPLRYWLAIYSKNVVRFVLEKLLRTEFLISTRVHADEVFDEDPFGKAVPCEGLFFLVKEGPKVVTRPVTQSSMGELAGQIIASADLNDSLYSLLADREEVEQVVRLERGVIQRFLEQVEQVTYVNTRLLDLADLRQFVHDHLNARS